MNRISLVGVLLAAAAVPSSPKSVVAQDERHQVFDTVVIREDRMPDRMRRMLVNRRARLGIKVNLQPKPTDSLGAYVDAVLPSGPAAKAGIRSGDIITKLDGRTVLADRKADEIRHGQSLSGLKLIELAARLEPNDTVPVEFLRGKDRKTVSVVTEPEPDFFAERDGRPFTMHVGPGGPPMPGDFPDGVDFMPPGRDFLAGGPLADLELAPLNSDLGQYFGATDGVLVISAPKDGKLGLKGGDVVLAVDGRKPTGPSNLIKILRSYDRGETFKIDILRNRKRDTVSASLGEK
jgi:S1-C subfamily serine protease